MKTQASKGNAFIKDDGGKSFLGNAIRAFLTALLIATGIILLCAILLFSKPNCLPYAGIIGCACGAVTALLCGIFAGAGKRHTGALAGLLAGCLFLALLLLVGVFFHNAVPLPKKLVGYAIFLVLAVLGGLLGAGRAGAKRHKRRRR